MVGAQHENRRAALFVDEDCVDNLLNYLVVKVKHVIRYIHVGNNISDA